MQAQTHDGERGEEAGAKDGCARSGVPVVGNAEAVVHEAVLAHAHKHAGGGGDAGKGTGEHADECAEVDQGAEEVDTGEGREDAHWSGGFAKVLVHGVHAEGFEIRAKDEKEAGEDGALDDCAGDRAQWVTGFGAKRGGALEANEAEEGEDDTETNSGGGDSVELDLGVVEMQTIAPEE